MLPAQDLLVRFKRQIDRDPRRNEIRSDYRTRPFISVAEARDLTGLSASRVYQLVSSGSVKRGGVGIYYIDQVSLVRSTKKGGRKRA